MKKHCHSRPDASVGVNEDGNLSFYRFTNLNKFSDILFHAIFTRHFGVSEKPFDSLNVRFGIGDKEQNVIENRKIIFKILRFDEDNSDKKPYSKSGLKNAPILVSANQTHSKNVVVIPAPDSDVTSDGLETKAGIYHRSPIRDRSVEMTDTFDNTDAIITNSPGFFLMMQVADCQAILLFDPIKKVIANIHAGWKGQVQNITGETIKKMQAEFECNPKNIIAAISPSLGSCCSEFSDPYNEFPKKYHKYVNRSLDSLKLARDDRMRLSFRPREHKATERRNLHIDLWKITLHQLLEAGILEENIEFSNICTCCNTKDYYSFRGEKGGTGRFGVVIGLKLNDNFVK